jgi:hypothetical protein
MPSSKKVPKLIIGLQMAKFTAFPAENPSIGNFSQLQPMKKFTKESVILLPVNYLNTFILPGSPGLFSVLKPPEKQSLNV